MGIDVADDDGKHGNVLDDIWAGDLLKRKDEAQLLERFLIEETEVFARQGREEAVVLALDAQYGEGKSWFLERFRKQLEINHPVAFVNAWIDDSNNEPLVSLMAELEDCLKPFLKTTDLKAKMKSLSSAAWPILGKAAMAAGGKLAAKHLGEQFTSDASDVLNQARSGDPNAKSTAGEMAEAASDTVVNEVSQVVDTAGKAMLKQYRIRQRSRSTFKSSLAAIAESLRREQIEGKQGPIFIVIDELDRCRPSYAIALLEDIKHLFDVPGLVFVIALHSGQLQESVKAIYGNDFNGPDYLRRFFTRHYRLRRLSLEEFVASNFEWIPQEKVNLAAPPIYMPNGANMYASPAQIVGMLLSEWHTSPREALRILDGLRLFIDNWNLGYPIQLPSVLAVLWHFVRSNQVHMECPPEIEPRTLFVVSDGNGKTVQVDAGLLIRDCQKLSRSNLKSLIERGGGASGSATYLMHELEAEFQIRSGNRASLARRFPSWSEYPDRVMAIGRFLEVEPEGPEEP